MTKTNGSGVGIPILFNYSAKVNRVILELREEGVSIGIGEERISITIEEMKDVGTLLFQAEKVLQAHDIYLGAREVGA
jgi:hypothetical protein